jgi:hypothetical protein
VAERSNGRDAAARRGWIFLVGAFTESFLVYAVLGWFLSRGRSMTEAPLPTPPALYACPAILCFLSAVLARRLGQAPDPASFRRTTVLSMAFLGLNALVGLVLSVHEARFEPSAIFAGFSVATAILFVIPAVLSFFRGTPRVPAAPAAPPIDPS